MGLVTVTIIESLIRSLMTLSLGILDYFFLQGDFKKVFGHELSTLVNIKPKIDCLSFLKKCLANRHLRIKLPVRLTVLIERFLI